MLFVARCWMRLRSFASSCKRLHFFMPNALWIRAVNIFILFYLTHDFALERLTMNDYPMIFTTIFMDSKYASWVGLVSATCLYYFFDGDFIAFLLFKFVPSAFETHQYCIPTTSGMLFVACCGMCLRSSTCSWKRLRFLMCPECSFAPQRPTWREGWRMLNWC